MTFFGERPDEAQIDAWNQTYLSHRRDPQTRTECAMPDCHGRFPCALRLDAAELLILAGIGVPTAPKLSGEVEVQDPASCRVIPWSSTQATLPRKPIRTSRPSTIRNGRHPTGVAALPVAAAS
ncbi:hypothetical protein [Asanoa sp. NPDC050611]|uniref:hypothetical protein n=1 Tax=Asanoa sp. NPDC050611 TaxID=3157098 RepID=UPI0033CB3288